MHFSLFHYALNLLCGSMILRELKYIYCFGQILFVTVVSMLFVSVSLLVFAHPERYYAGFSSIVLGWYTLLEISKIICEKSNSKKAKLMVDGIIYAIISLLIPGVSVLMHLAGIVSGIIAFLIVDNGKIKTY